MPEDENGETMPRRLYCLTMPPAQLPYEGCSWASAMLSLRMSYDVALRARVLTTALQMTPEPSAWTDPNLPQLIVGAAATLRSSIALFVFQES